jgi:DNA-binding NarL/FixJ family response regulator
LPDVIVTDTSMPSLDGISVAALTRRTNPDARIVLVTVHSEPTLVERRLAAGALGYVLGMRPATNSSRLFRGRSTAGVSSSAH